MNLLVGWKDKSNNICYVWKNKQTMYKLLKPILLRFLTTTGCKRLVVDLCRAFVKQTSNTVDDKLVDLLEQNLFPKLN